MKMYQKNRGFTLLEIMLVIALASIIVIAGISTYDLKVKNFKVDKTALQMQQWMQASLAYYADKGFWPADPAHPDDPKAPLRVLVRTGYMSGNINIDHGNPFGKGFSAPTPPEGALYFQLQTTIPKDAEGKSNMYSLTSQIAGHLPDARITPQESEGATTTPSCPESGCNVIAALSPPGGTTSGLNGGIIWTGTLNVGQKIPMERLSCPAATTLTTHVALAGFASPVNERFPKQRNVPISITATVTPEGIVGQDIEKMDGSALPPADPSQKVFVMVTCQPNEAGPSAHAAANKQASEYYF